MLSCFLSDDTLAIFEPIMKNSGIVGGKYLERRQVIHPDSHPPMQGQHTSLSPGHLTLHLCRNSALPHVVVCRQPGKAALSALSRYAGGMAEHK